MKVVVKKRDPSIPVNIGTEFIKLDAALKYANAVESAVWPKPLSRKVTYWSMERSAPCVARNCIPVTTSASTAIPMSLRSMHLSDIFLRDFRNYRELNLAFDEGVNLIVGENAQGKTNLLEAIAYLGSGKGFRTQKSAELVRLGADFADLSGQMCTQERCQSIRWVLFPAGRPRQLYRNGIKKKTTADISGMLQTVLFCPEDLMILKTGASNRRKLGDSALSQLRPNYEAALTEYNRILEQKNRILKDRYENPALLEILPEFNARLCQVGALLISYRARFYEGLGREAKVFHETFSGGREEFHLQYHTVSTVTDPFAPVSVLEGQLQDHLQSHYRAELESARPYRPS